MATSELEKAAYDHKIEVARTLWIDKQITSSKESFLAGAKWLMEQVKEINGESIADSQFWGHHAMAWELEEKLKQLTGE